MPSRSIIVGVELLHSSTVIPLSSSEAIERPPGRSRIRGLEAQLLDALVADLDLHAELVPAQGVLLDSLRVVGLELAKVARALVVVEDVVPVEIVHGSAQPSECEQGARPPASRSGVDVRAGRTRPGRPCRGAHPEAAHRAAGRSGVPRGCTRRRGPASRRCHGCIPSIVKRPGPRPRLRRSHHPQPRHLSETLEHVPGQRALVPAPAPCPRRKVAPGRAQPNRLGDRWGARFELPGRLVQLRRLRSTEAIMSPPRQEGLHRVGAPAAVRARRRLWAPEPCGRSTRRSPAPMAPRLRAVWGRPEPVDDAEVAPPRGSPDISSTGLMVPRTFDTWAKATSFTSPRASSRSRASVRGRPARPPPGSAARPGASGRGPARGRCSRGAPSG